MPSINDLLTNFATYLTDLVPVLLIFLALMSASLILIVTQIVVIKLSDLRELIGF